MYILKHKSTKCPNQLHLFEIAKRVCMIAERGIKMYVSNGSMKIFGFIVLFLTILYSRQLVSFSSTPSCQNLNTSNSQTTSNLNTNHSQNLNASHTQATSDSGMISSSNINLKFNECQCSEEVNDSERRDKIRKKVVYSVLLGGEEGVKSERKMFTVL